MLLLFLLFLAGLFVNFALPELVDVRPYSRYEWYANTGLTFTEEPGHQTLALIHGKPNSWWKTDDFYREVLHIEWEAPLIMERRELTAGKVKLDYWFNSFGGGYGIAENRSRGWIEIELVEEARIIASYDITLTTTGWTTKQRTYQGRSVAFARQPRPSGGGSAANDDLLPK